MEWVVYKISRSDGKIYIGKTSVERYKKRMYDHKRSKRFINYEFKVEILYKTLCHDNVLEKEKQFIESFDSYHNGLNESIDGSGNHLALNFTTLGVKFSEETKQKISQKAKGNRRALGLVHSEETKKIWSEKRKGKVWSKKFSVTQIRTLMTDFKVFPVSEISTSKNGRPLSHLRNFCNKNAKKYNMSNKTMENILSGKTIAWEHLYKEILDTKS